MSSLALAASVKATIHQFGFLLFSMLNLLHICINLYQLSKTKSPHQMIEIDEYHACYRWKSTDTNKQTIWYCQSFPQRDFAVVGNNNKKQKQIGIFPQNTYLNIFGQRRHSGWTPCNGCSNGYVNKWGCRQANKLSNGFLVHYVQRITWNKGRELHLIKLVTQNNRGGSTSPVQTHVVMKVFRENTILML